MLGLLADVVAIGCDVAGIGGVSSHTSNSGKKPPIITVPLDSPAKMHEAIDTYKNQKFYNSCKELVQQNICEALNNNFSWAFIQRLHIPDKLRLELTTLGYEVRYAKTDVSIYTHISWTSTYVKTT